MKNKWQDKTALISGASSGIGEAISKRMVAEGMHIIMTPRRIKRMKKTAEGISR